MIWRRYFVALAILSVLFRFDGSVLPLNLAIDGRRYSRHYEIDARIWILLICLGVGLHRAHSLISL